MALGKPVFCYLRKDLFKYNPIWKHCPIINVNPETLEDSIIKFLKKSKISRHKIGMESRKYIEKFHCLEVVGKKCSKIIKKLLTMKQIDKTGINFKNFLVSRKVKN